jgi:hypothetical protein
MQIYRNAQRRLQLLDTTTRQDNSTSNLGGISWGVDE